MKVLDVIESIKDLWINFYACAYDIGESNLGINEDTPIYILMPDEVGNYKYSERKEYTEKDNSKEIFRWKINGSIVLNGITEHSLEILIYVK